MIMTLQPNATRSSNAGPGNAGLSLPTSVIVSRKAASYAMLRHLCGIF
jgi:hypothetical protein